MAKTKILISSAFLVVLLLPACIGGMDKYGAKIKRMHADQITIDAILPANAPSISQQYHRLPKGNINEQRKEHLGIDITAAKGTAVIAPANGVVSASYFEPFYGNTVEVDHGRDAAGRQLHTIYKHLADRKVQSGDRLVRGQEIGGLGRTGALSSGILHLHFEVLREDEKGKLTQVDPSLYWADGVGRVTCFAKSKHWPDKPFKTTYPVICKAL